MIKNPGSNFDTQAIISLIVLNALLLGFVIAWLIFQLSPKPHQRPGINFKEF